MKLIPPTSIKMLATCQQCDLQQIIPGTNENDCRTSLEKLGWDRDWVQGTETCPACVQAARDNPRTDQPAWMPSSTG